MLLSLVLGDQTSPVNNDWEKSVDSYGGHFIENTSIRQRIRLGKNVADKLELAYSSSNAKGYEIAKNIFFSNNYKNMNINVINYRAQEENEEPHVDDHLLYVTMLNKNYELLDYDVKGYQVVQTYRKRDSHQGLAILLDDLDDIDFSDKDVDILVLTIGAFDISRNRIVDIDVYLTTNYRLEVNIGDVLDRGRLKDLRKIHKEHRFHHFVLSVRNLPTNTFLVDSEVSDDDLKRIVEGIDNEANVLIIPEGQRLFFDIEKAREEKRELTEAQIGVMKMLNDLVVNERVRAVTLVNVKVPKTFCREYSLLYLFQYSLDSDTFFCVKSN